ncbi:hypothetical protein PEL8287_01560 [Roseovarius litorisediminis]|uniref:Uncharacterized protein n=1 Tax=Roseovarius litorisediminis TaxID=1312363 RepID=A0A1Y5S6Z3_9RHOB|nr:hypothetical protein [Roseovarius litorisediminis]SLN32646.1 hypothetical protein PEL8287_01560 [Roseovarius litorisediminis]
MNGKFGKAEARQSRYKQRARGARKWAHRVMFLLLVSCGAALWMDESIGPDLQKRVFAAMAELETASVNEKGASGAFQAAFAKLVL